jgi:hypothetical protein
MTYSFTARPERGGDTRKLSIKSVAAFSRVIMMLRASSQVVLLLLEAYKFILQGVRRIRIGVGIELGPIGVMLICY